MDTLFPETPSDMLYSFMDGELEIPKENILFDELARNPELRAEMRDLLAIRAEVHEDDEAFTPPVSTTKALFTTLGMTAPMAPAIPSAAVPAGNFLMQAGEKVSSVFAQIWLPALTGVLGAVAAYFIINGSNEGHIASLEQQHRSALERRDETIAGLETERNTLAARLDESREQLAQARGSETVRYVQVPVEKYINTGQDPVQQGSVVRQETLAALPPDIEPNRNSLPAESYIQARQNPFSPVNPVADSQDENIFASSDRNIHAQLRSIGGRSYPSPDLGYEESLLSNFAVRLALPYSKRVTFGAEAGKENFALVYSGSEGGAFVNNEKSANIFWLGLSAQYNIAEVYEHVNLFGRGIAGASEVGPLAKGLLGFEYQPLQTLGIMVGAEYSWLGYRYQEQAFSTQKLGFTLGFNTRF